MLVERIDPSAYSFVPLASYERSDPRWTTSTEPTTLVEFTLGGQRRGGTASRLSNPDF